METKTYEQESNAEEWMYRMSHRGLQTKVTLERLTKVWRRLYTVGTFIIQNYRTSLVHIFM